jgi:bifunctional enzyme CysN/CysC
MLHAGVGAEKNALTIDLLRVVTCGSVDDGKSTLIGRLLFDLGALSEDQLQEIGADTATSPDFSLALDGLAAEREQGITIDVAYRSFSSARRRFLLADVPGHEQYTRNMVTGASAADVALLVIDVRNGLLVQTRRHAYLARLLGIRCFVLAVNKMDLVDFDEHVFREVVTQCDAMIAQLGPAEFHAIPCSARFGDNVVERSTRTAWFQGPTLAEALDGVRIENESEAHPFRFPVQWVNRSLEGGRGYSGTIASGRIKAGAAIKIVPSNQDARIADIVTFNGPLGGAAAGQAVTVTIDRKIDVGRGHILCAAQTPASCADALEASVIWMGDSPLVRGRSYQLKIGPKSTFGQIVRVSSKIDLETFAYVPAETLGTNEIGICSLTLDEVVAFDPYEQNRETGSFIVIDRVSNDTIGAGLIQTGELRFRDVPWQIIEVTKASRSSLKNHPAAVLWFTGIPGAGKSTIANLVEKMLHANGRHTYLLDGDNVRHGLNRDLGFSDSDRVENVRRVSEVARLMADAGLVVLVALISPFRAERRTARKTIGDEEFVEIFIDTALELAEARDVKGHYRKARRGDLTGFTGIDSEYQRPEHPELHIETSKMSAEEAARKIVTYVERLLQVRRAALAGKP